VLLQLSMLFTAFLCSYYIKRSKFLYLQEAGASLLLGVVVGCAVEFSKVGGSVLVFTGGRRRWVVR
jgi:hypothetical protein